LKEKRIMKLQPTYSGTGDILKEGEHTSSLHSWLQRGYFWGTLFFSACIVVQVFLAGLAVLVSGSFVGAHKTFGYLIIWFPIILLLIGLSGRLPRSINWLTALLAVLALLQPLLIKVPHALGLPLLSALHPVNALAVFTLPLFLSYRAWQLRRQPAATRST
jgi:Family of unknown function (DUF6220)